jgi:hypothetical protein
MKDMYSDRLVFAAVELLAEVEISFLYLVL